MKKTTDSADQTSRPFAGENLEVAPSKSSRIRNELGQYLKGHNGHVKRYQDAESLQAGILQYFEDCQQNDEPLTMTGLALSLGFRSRQALINYEKEPGYEFAFEVIQFAKMKVEEYTEKNLHNPKANIVGAIFSLKNNWGWQDRQDIKMDQRTLQFTGFEIEGLNESNETIDIKTD